ncbi:MAG TPA: hypothetical protein VJ044_20755 [Candidatus Hodarchaeales archaeon]|nr:hypothetical protein [Candidatus Hodarchaeales archaeon]
MKMKIIDAEGKALREKISSLQKRIKNNRIDRKTLEQAAALLDEAEKKGVLSVKEKIELKAFKTMLPLVKKILK